MFRKVPAKAALAGIGAVPLLIGAAQAQTRQPSAMSNMPGMSSSSEARDTETQTSGIGTVTAVNAAKRKITLDHAPIPAIGWPAMKMEFPTAASVDLKTVKPGDKVQFTLAGAKNSYTVESISSTK